MSFVEDLLYNLTVDLAVAGILAILGIVFRRKIRLKLRRLWYFVTNKRVPVSLLLVRKYEGPIQKPVSHEVFQSLISRIEGDALTLRSITSETLSISSEKLSLDLEMEFAPELDLGTIETETPKVIDYKLAVRPKTRLRWGRREVEDLAYLALLLEKMADTAETLCLKRGERPLQEFLLVDYKQDSVPIRRTPAELRDRALGVQLTIKDHDVRAVLAGPQRLVTFAKRNIPA